MIEAQSLTKVYGGTVAVDGIDFQAKPGLVRNAAQISERREYGEPDGQCVRRCYHLFADQAVERVALGLAAELPHRLGVRGIFVEAVEVGRRPQECLGEYPAAGFQRAVQFREGGVEART